LGLWRYSLAALIVAAAMFDALLLVPAQRRERPDREPSVSAEISRCRHARELDQQQGRPAKRIQIAPHRDPYLHYIAK